MTFQALDLKERNFLELVDNDNNTLKPIYCKGGTWLQFFRHSNMLCAKATRAITNYAPIGEYHLRFFPNEEFPCPCSLYPIKTRQHILYKCRRFNKYWNPRKDSIAHFTQFLERNLRAFAFTSIQILTCWYYKFFLLIISFSSLFFSLLILFFLLHVVSVLLYVVTKQLPQSAIMLHVRNC